MLLLKKSINKILLVLFILFFYSSCVPYNKMRYFNDINQFSNPVPNPRTQKVIMPFDFLYIKVLSIDERTNSIFSGATQGGAISTNMIGYAVNEDGNIDFPFTGSIHVGGLTCEQAGKIIEKSLSEYIPKTSICVSYLDNKVSVIGEVNTPGVYNFTQDKINIYEALALGGGIARSGNRKKVVLIRQEGENIMHYRLDVSDSKITSSRNFYILPNDVLVVEPTRVAVWNYNSFYQTVIMTSVSLMTLYLLINQSF